MISFRRTSKNARVPSTLTFVISICALLAALPAMASAAPTPTPQLAFEPGSYDFGLLQANRENSQATFQLRNNGEATAQVYSVDIVGSGSGAYWTGMNDCNARYLSPNETCSVQVYFNPYDAVPFVAQLHASSEEGTDFYADLSGEGGRAMIGAGTDPTNFGSVAVGSAGVTKTIEVTNSGNYPGAAFIAVIAGGAIGSFQLLDEGCTGVPLFPGSSCNLVVRFQPLSTGVKTARLGLFGDSDGGGMVTLTGVGADPEVAVAASSSPASTSVVSTDSTNAKTDSTNAKKAKKKRLKQQRRQRLQRQRQRQRLQRQRQRHHRVAVRAQR